MDIKVFYLIVDTLHCIQIALQNRGTVPDSALSEIREKVGQLEVLVSIQASRTEVNMEVEHGCTRDNLFL